MRVRIVSYEDINAWILGKFARRLHEELLKLGVEVDIANKIDAAADINHHIIYLGYDEQQEHSAIDTLMVTHVDNLRKLDIVKRQLNVAKLGICMSKPTADELATAGIPVEKLNYINAAHDGVIVPKKYNMGITSKVQPDGCKREGMLLSLCERVSPEDFRFTIMGMGWEDIIEAIRKRGFEVRYYNDFNYDEYVKLIPTLDYYLYFGQDEGSMGFIDALAAGVKTIVTPQGYHLDAPGGITHPFNEIHELVDIFNQLAAERRSLINSVSTWTWRDYAIKHVEVWEHLLHPEKAVVSKYTDGVNSIGQANRGGVGARSKYVVALYTVPFTRAYQKLRRVKDFKTFVAKLKGYLIK
ncbi:MAG TPA: hypothetical protein VK658_24055 [Chryseolinea sp.]|nr:hypothetical protein [Chryseolinea sp.]